MGAGGVNARRLQQVLQEAVAHHQAGRLAAADRLYRDVLRAAPRQADALQLAGVVALQQGRPGDAADLLGRAVREAPRSAVGLMRLGVALLQLGRHAEAEERLGRAVAMEPKLAEAWGHRSAVLETLGRTAEAVDAAERAVALQPKAAEWRERLGALLVATRGHAAAAEQYRRLVAEHPGHAAGWANLGVCLTYDGKVSEALACFDRALAADPTLHHAHVGRGLALERCHRIAEACESYGRAIAGQPDHWQARSARLLCLHYLAGVSREMLGREHREFGAALAAQATGLPARVGVHLSVGGAKPAGFVSADLLPSGSAPTERGTSCGAEGAERRLRVGFLSADLRRHAVANFIEPLLRHLDRDSFEVVLYHDHPQQDEASERLRSYAVRWRQVAGQSATALFNQVRADQLDVAVDLAGHTGINRLPLFARRMAPVQVTYLGYPDTTGLEAMDYRLVDAITDPPGEAEQWHSEKLIRFAPTAWSYAPPEQAPEVAPPPARPHGHVTFGCFNNFAKVTDEMLGRWAQLLAAVPGSRLLLKGSGLTDPVLKAAAERRLALAGLPRERVTLLERTETEVEHLAAYARVDVALDTFPYHGTTTTCEALWMGVPVVTLAGDRHAARVGVSLLTAVGRAEWVAYDAGEYVRIGAALAAAAAQPAWNRGELREAMRRSVLLDHAGQARRFGAALQQMARECGATAAIVPDHGELLHAPCR